MTDVADIPTRDLLNELDRRHRAAQPPKVLFYGVWPGDTGGHYLRDEEGTMVPSRIESELQERDGFLYPFLGRHGRQRPQEEGRLWHWRHPTKPITALLSWDRSADRRGNCCASFVVYAEVTPEQALARAREVFPAVFVRIEKHLGRPVHLAGPSHDLEEAVKP